MTNKKKIRGAKKKEVGHSQSVSIKNETVSF